MTGEMSRDDVTHEAFPLHFVAADECGGTVHPFDVYQGPYIHIPGHGRFWLTGEDGACRWWGEHANTLSYEFFAEMEGWAANALAELVSGEYAIPVEHVTCAEDAQRLADIGEF